jgi:ABC-2 type transport system ATP-binding protein
LKNKKKRIEETLAQCFLAEVKQKKIAWLSKGFKQRVCLAQSIIHDPDYLILDEPTDGLDPNQKEEVRRMLKDMGSTKAIILSTHILEEADAVCSRVIIIANGKIVAADTPENLKKYSRMHKAVTLEIEASEPNKPLRLIADIENVASVKIAEQKENALKLIAFPKKNKAIYSDKITSVLRDNEYKINSVFIEKGRLDEVFRKFTLNT